MVLGLLERQMKSASIRGNNPIRILYLRPFKDMTSDNALIISLAINISAIGRLVVIGSADGEKALQVQWQKRFGDDQPFDDHIEYKQSGDRQWRRLVHQEISQADCVLLFMEPKGRKFPRLHSPKIGKGLAADYWAARPIQQSTGSGLLYEIAYLERLKKIKRTIILCEARNTSHVRQLIHQSFLHMPAGFVLIRAGPDRWRVPTPRFSALDMQIGSLHDSQAIVEFKYKDLRNLHSQFSTTLNSLIERVCSKPRTGRGVSPQASAMLLGRSDEPRRLPPDSARKIIQFTNVEDIIRIPPLELTEVSPDEVPHLLSEESPRICPYCEQSLSRIFFYVFGLHRSPDDFVLGRCQHCFGWVGIEDGMLRNIGIST